MKKFTIYYNGCTKYMANSDKEAWTMFENDYLKGSTMEIDKIIEEEINEDD